MFSDSSQERCVGESFLNSWISSVHTALAHLGLTLEHLRLHVALQQRISSRLRKQPLRNGMNVLSDLFYLRRARTNDSLAVVYRPFSLVQARTTLKNPQIQLAMSDLIYKRVCARPMFKNVQSRTIQLQVIRLQDIDDTLKTSREAPHLFLDAIVNQGPL